MKEDGAEGIYDGVKTITDPKSWPDMKRIGDPSGSETHQSAEHLIIQMMMMLNVSIMLLIHTYKLCNHDFCIHRIHKKYYLE